VRRRIEAILDWAKALKYREGDNPAKWSALQHHLPDPTKLRPVEHLDAMPAEDIPGLIEALRTRQGVSPAAIEFAILTAVRTNELLGARWSEIDWANRIWTIPAERMKGRKNKTKDHRVPLTTAAIAVLQRMEQLRQNEFVFPGQGGNGALKRSSMRVQLRNMGCTADVHGFRASFRTWAAEQTGFPAEIAEASLGHKVGTQVERTYRRGDFFNRRRRLMDAWGGYCCSPPGAAARIALGAGR
jgi:integrase